MDEQQNKPNHPTNRRKKQRSQLRVFKETYLPIIIGFITALLVIVFIAGAVIRGIQRIQYEKQLALEASIAAQEEQDRLTHESKRVLSEAASLASHFDYEGALMCLESFSGDIAAFPEMQEKYDAYADACDALVLWDDTASIPNLSFHPLIADPSRAFTDETYGTSYNRNFITVSEFHNILQQLYENNYILVSLRDVTTGAENKELYLPEGKKPLILTQTNANYYTYMVDGDGDRLPDKDGAGFASKLTEDANGNITCELVTADGKTVTGAYDIVPILESFIETHPDFSYKGARAILAVTGYDGILGYRTNPAAREHLGEDAYTRQLDEAEHIVNRLHSMGYEFACYTYGNEAYGNLTSEQITTDLSKWENEVAPVTSVLKDTDILVFAQNSDINTTAAPYSGDKFEVLKSYGFTRFLGFSSNDTGWFYTGDGYIRQGRLLVTGSYLAHHAPWFEDLFDANAILDTTRGDVPA